MNIKRGEVYFVSNAKNYMKGEGSGRPAIVVSSDMENHADRVMVVFTTKQDKQLEKNVAVNLHGVTSYAICNNVHTIYKDRLEKFVCEVTEDEMRNIEEQIKICLGLNSRKEPSWKDKPLCIGCVEKDKYKLMEERANKAETKLAIYKEMYNELLERIIETA